MEWEASLAEGVSRKKTPVTIQIEKTDYTAPLFMPAKPKLGQNFLVDPAAVRSIVDALGDISNATVVEIGPGRASMTRALATRSQRLIAIELDPVLAADLRDRFASDGHVEIIEKDVLALDFPSLIRPNEEKLVVAGNLPYYITSDILLHLFAAHAVISRAVIMIQREVADRIAANPGSSDYGILSATTQLYARVEKLFTLPPTAFSPSPEVFSTVLRLTMASRFADLGVDPNTFIPFLRQSFAQKRKTLANNLRSAGYDPQMIAEAFERAGVAQMSRAEALPLETAALLFRKLNSADSRLSSQENSRAR